MAAREDENPGPALQLSEAEAVASGDGSRSLGVAPSPVCSAVGDSSLGTTLGAERDTTECVGGSHEIPPAMAQEPGEETSDLDEGHSSPLAATTSAVADNHDAWSCPICLSWFDTPVAPPCQHSFCSGCLKSFVRAAASRPPANGGQPVRPACPLCRETFSPETVVPNAGVFEDMLKATVACKNEDCGAQFCPLRWKHHQEECPAASVQCSHHTVGCSWKGKRRDVSEHVNGCAYEKIKGLVPRVSASLKQLHTQVHALEARVMAQNATAANTRAFVMSMHQRERRGALFPAIYALLWRPQDWRHYTCPSSDGVMSNATLICFAPIAFLALWGAGVFGSGSEIPIVQRAICLVGLAILGFLTLVEFDNSAPWHELRYPCVLNGLRIGPTLLGNTVRVVVYTAMKALPETLQWPAVFLLLAPLTFPTVVQGLHRFQVKLKNAQIQAQIQAGHGVPPRTLPRSSPIKVFGPTVNGIVWAAAMLAFGHEALLVAQIMAKLGLCLASSFFSPDFWDEMVDKIRAMSVVGLPEEETEHIQQLHDRNRRSMKAPFPSLTAYWPRVCVCMVSTWASVVLVSAYSDSLRAIGYALIVLSAMDGCFTRWEIHAGRWVMVSLEQTTMRLNVEHETTRNSSVDLCRSRLLLLWVLFGSACFVLLMLLSSSLVAE